jgi:hypothetical protein
MGGAQYNRAMHGHADLGGWGGQSNMFGNSGLMNNPRSIFSGLGRTLGSGLGLRGIGNRPFGPAFSGTDDRRFRRALSAPFGLR